MVGYDAKGMSMRRIWLLAVIAVLSVATAVAADKRGRRVICIGETVIDILFRGDQTIGSTPGGSAYNTAISLGRAGVNTVFVGDTGNDRAGHRIRRFLAENGVDSSAVRVYDGMKSTVSLAYLDEHNNARYSFYMNAPRERKPFVRPEIQKDDIVVFGSFYAANPAVRTALTDFLDYARACGAILYYDINIRSAHANMLEQMLPNIEDNLHRADIVRGSRGDVATVFGTQRVDSLYDAHIAKACARFINTGGANPVRVFAPGFRGTYPVKPIKTVSTIGAGDNFNAGVAYALIRLGITRQQLQQGLTEQQWAQIADYAGRFSQDCCLHLENYISVEFGRQMQY
uniref:Carbohydrate kinase n=1 Tax=Prevotella sp. GTC17260 TaxID=3236796 RepID=A0AB33JB92_9BACT